MQSRFGISIYTLMYVINTQNPNSSKDKSFEFHFILLKHQLKKTIAPLTDMIILSISDLLYHVPSIGLFSEQIRFDKKKESFKN